MSFSFADSGPRLPLTVGTAFLVMLLPAAAAAEPTFPEGFRATVFAEGVGRARHIAARDNGDLYVALRDGSGIVALRDEDGDGRAERQEKLEARSGTGIGIRGGYLYFSSDSAVYRVPLAANELVPTGEIETVVDGFPQQRSHASKAFAFDAGGGLYVNVGSPSNACQEESRTRGSPGMSPCPQLEEHAGIWRFSADEVGQTFAAGRRYATGVRNTVALDWNPQDDALYLVQHGRDQLHELWPEIYTAEENAVLPAEEFHRVTEGMDAGWPYTYWDAERNARMVSPEYGGDGETQADEGRYATPLTAFPAHWAPNDLLFYSGTSFPEQYHGGAFIAFHGSWNRSPLPQEGYNVVFVPFTDGHPARNYQIFADGFAGSDDLASSRAADFRPMGLAEGPDGALFIADSARGRIWRVTAVE